MKKLHLLPMLVLSGLHAMENSNNYLASIEYLAQPIILNWIGHPQFTAKNQEQNVNKPIQTREEYFLSEFYYKSDTIQYVDDIFIPLSITSKELNNSVHSYVALKERKEAKEKFLEAKSRFMWAREPFISDNQKNNLLIEKALKTEWIKKIDPMFCDGVTIAVAVNALRWHGRSRTDLSKRFLKTCLPKMQEKQFQISDIQLNKDENKIALDELLKENDMYFERDTENPGQVIIRRLSPLDDERLANGLMCSIQ